MSCITHLPQKKKKKEKPRNPLAHLTAHFSLFVLLEALPILCGRCARLEKERERERERERDAERETEREREIYRERERERQRERRKWRHLSSDEICDEFCTFPHQKIAPQFWRRVLECSLPKMCTFFCPLEGRWAHTFRCKITLRSSKQFAFFVLFLSNWVTGDRNKRSNFRLHRPSSVRKNEWN